MPNRTRWRQIKLDCFDMLSKSSFSGKPSETGQASRVRVNLDCVEEVSRYFLLDQSAGSSQRLQVAVVQKVADVVSDLYRKRMSRHGCRSLL